MIKTFTHTLPFIHRHRKESNLEPSVGLFPECVPSKLMQEFKIVQHWSVIGTNNVVEQHSDIHPELPVPIFKEISLYPAKVGETKRLAC